MGYRMAGQLGDYVSRATNSDAGDSGLPKYACITYDPHHQILRHASKIFLVTTHQLKQS